MRSFWAGLAGLMLVVSVVTCYQSVTVSRTQADTIAELQNELNEAKNEVEEYKALAASGGSKSKETAASASSEILTESVRRYEIRPTDPRPFTSTPS